MAATATLYPRPRRLHTISWGRHLCACVCEGRSQLFGMEELCQTFPRHDLIGGRGRRQVCLCVWLCVCVCLFVCVSFAAPIRLSRLLSDVWQSTREGGWVASSLYVHAAHTHVFTHTHSLTHIAHRHTGVRGGQPDKSGLVWLYLSCSELLLLSWFVISSWFLDCDMFLTPPHCWRIIL